MIVKQIMDEDFVNYSKPAMFIAFPKCNWKCEKECGERVCQNSALAAAPSIEIDTDTVIDRYVNNPITQAVVLGGLEPFDSFEDLFNFIIEFRKKSNDDIVIYTGYTEKEIHQINRCKAVFTIDNETEICYEDFDLFNFITQHYQNIIVKFGRYIPNHEPHYDEVLGIYLASDNQYAVRK